MITQNELAILKAIDDSEYGDSLRDPVWMFSASNRCGLEGKVISGTVASLVKKGYVQVSEYHYTGKDSNTIVMTYAGIQAYIEITNGATKKYA